MKRFRFVRWLTVCLVSLVGAALLCLSASALENQDNLLTLHPEDMDTTLSGSNDHFTWNKNGNFELADIETDSYTGAVIRAAGGMFRVYDTHGVLDDAQAVIISTDILFSALPSGTHLSGGTLYAVDPSSELAFRSQSVLSWCGNVGQGLSYDGLRIDSEGNLYIDSGLSSAIGVRLDTDVWYNVQLVCSAASNKTEIWIDGKLVATTLTNGRFRDVSQYVRFFDGSFSYEANLKNIRISVSDEPYYCGLVKEPSADFIAHQTSKPTEDGSFSLRILAGIDHLNYRRFGYRIIKLTKDADGNTVSKELSGHNYQAFSKVLGDGTAYDIQKEFGRPYACLATVDGLNVSEAFTELVIYPYTVSVDGTKVYGTPTSLTYVGKTDDKGFPIFENINTAATLLTPSDDTYIYNVSGYNTSDQGSARSFMVRNTGSEAADLYRAAYYKFTIPKELVADMEHMVNVFLYVTVNSYETHAERTKYPLALYGAGTNWTENTLTYVTRHNAARDRFPLETIDGELCRGTIRFDVLNYILSQPTNDDGSKTVAFCITQEDGHKDTLMLYLYSKEAGESTMPRLSFEKSLYGHVVTNAKTVNEGYEPLSHAETLVNEWFDELVDKIYPKDQNGNAIYHDELGSFDPSGYAATEATGDFTRELTWKNASLWASSGDSFTVAASAYQKARFARTLSTLGQSTANSFLASPYAQIKSEYDAFGGISNAGFKGTATGFFHTEKHTDGRTYVIDPLGNPYFAVGVNTVVYGSADTKNQQNYILDAYGTKENFFTEISASLREIGVNTAFTSAPYDLFAVKENGLAVTVGLSGAGDYMGSIGRSQVSEGVYPNNNTIDVFNPDFSTFVHKRNAEIITASGYADMDRLFAYTSSNELPSGTNILERYLTIDPQSPDNAFSYHTAWTWLARRLNMVNPTLRDLQEAPDYEQINSEFLSFLYATCYRTVRSSIEAVDKNHMYIGSRVNGNCPYDEGYLRAAGYYLDILTINLYGGLNPSKDTLSGIYRYSGKPFIVTEFFAKGMDAIDANGYPLANSTGAGILVHAQEDRAVYYENYVLNLLETRSCVGWSWYRFRDNDQSLFRFEKDGQVYEDMRPQGMTYGKNPYPYSLADKEGNLYWLEELYSGDKTLWQNAFEKTYSGEALASNHNVNKGFYNNNFSSVVTVYTYDAGGKLQGSASYEVVHPDSATLQNGTILMSKDGTQLFTIGENGTQKTVLTVYKGRYLALTDTIKTVSDHIMGLVSYFDAN